MDELRLATPQLATSDEDANLDAVALVDVLSELDGALAREPLVGDLVARGEVAMFHGQPRTQKTWCALEVAVAGSLGKSAFDLLPGPPRALRSLIVSNEDPLRATAHRLRDLFAGRGVRAVPPEGVFLMVGVGIDLDDADSQKVVLNAIAKHQIDLVILDPIRSLSAAVDAGPRELRPLACFLRELRSDGLGVLLVHHDVKPARDGVDMRRPAQRASGGGLFSIVDAPIHIEQITDARSLVVPDGFKFAVSPTSFMIERRVVDDATGAVTIVAVTPSTPDTKSAKALILEDRIVSHLRDSGMRVSGSAIASTLHANKVDVLGTLDRLSKAGIITAVDGPRKSQLWGLGNA